ncbi:hypothetical protein [Flavobacterium sp.]|uniref:hypothetical protein n=1 Tax=Flavobacterium sp. TaxID=239 RepID=UPI0039E488EA
MKTQSLGIWAAFIVQLAAHAQEKTPWELARYENDIAISYRWVSMGNSEKIREMQAVFTVDSEPDKIIAQFTDSKKLKGWSVSTEVCEVVPGVNNHWQTYMRFGLPWPLKSTDLISQCVLMVRGNVSIIKMNSIPTARPVYKSVTRINSLQSEWKFIPMGNGRTKVIYNSLTYARPEYPRYLTDGIIQNKLIHSIGLLKKQSS